jgi:hypothetical protein
VHDNVSAVVNRPYEEASGAKRVVDDDRHPGFVRDGNNLLKVGDIVLWVSDALDLGSYQSANTSLRSLPNLSPPLSGIFSKLT